MIPRHVAPPLTLVLTWRRRGAPAGSYALNPVTHPTTILVPAAAIRDGSVFLLLDGKAVRRAVKTGATSTQGIRIEQGLNGGEDLILNPPAGMKDGDKVRTKANA